MKADEQKIDVPATQPPATAEVPPPPPATSTVGEALSDFFATVKGAAFWHSKVFVGIAAVVVIGGLWWFLAGQSKKAASKLWTELEQLPPSELEAFAKAHQGDVPAKVARLEQARLLYGRDGMGSLLSPDAKERAKAIENITAARDQAVKLSQEFSNDLTLRGESLRLAAEAELTLASIPKPGSNNEFLGSATEAVKMLKDFAQSVGETTPIGERAAKRAADIEKNSLTVQSVGRELSFLVAPRNQEGPVAPPSLTPSTSTPPVPPKEPEKPIQLPTPPTGLTPPATKPAPATTPAPAPATTPAPVPPATKK